MQNETRINSTITAGAAGAVPASPITLGGQGMPATLTEIGATSGMLPYLVALGNPMHSDERQLLVQTMAEHTLEKAQEPLRKKAMADRLRAEEAEAKLRNCRMRQSPRRSAPDFDR